MSSLSIQDLALFTEGHLQLGALPPLGGELEPLGKIRTEVSAVQPGDIFWQCGPPADIHAAFASGALGVVYEGEPIEPWAGRFALQVRNSEKALLLAAVRARRQFGGCVIALADLASGDFGHAAGREFVHCLDRSAQLVSCAEPHTEQSMAREIIDLDDQRPFAVFNLYRQSSDLRHSLLKRYSPQLIVTKRAATGELPVRNTKVIFADDFSSVAELATAVADTLRTTYNEPLKALPSMSSLREHDMPTLLGRSNQLADWWLLGRSPWRVLPGRA